MELWNIYCNGNIGNYLKTMRKIMEHSKLCIELKYIVEYITKDDKQANIIASVVFLFVYYLKFLMSLNKTYFPVLKHNLTVLIVIEFIYFKGSIYY